jgi:regulator of sirC expression with transglutaminase-like and TPR domain
MPTDEKELRALFSLLDDTDRSVFQQVSERLVHLGRDIIPRLEDFWSQSLDPLIQERILDIIHRIQFDALKDGLRRWREKDEDDLLKGLILVARFQYPDLDEQKIRSQIDKMRESAVIETQMHHLPLEKTQALNRVLFGLFGFRGNTANFHSPQNSFINSVLETRKGNPLSLGCLYALLARHAGMPVYGVNLPEHFLLAYCPGGAAGTEEYTYPEAGVAFYINAFNRGNILKKADIDRFLDKLRITPTPACFAPCTHADILRRALHNLSAAYRNLGDTGRLHEIDELLDCLAGE